MRHNAFSQYSKALQESLTDHEALGSCSRLAPLYIMFCFTDKIMSKQTFAEPLIAIFSNLCQYFEYNAKQEPFIRIFRCLCKMIGMESNLYLKH